MYTNRLSRTTSNQHPKFHIRLSDFAIDPRVAYVESVCRALIESRFGPDFIFEPFVTDLGDRPELEPAFFSDLLEDGEMVPSDFLSHLSFLGRITQIGHLCSSKLSGTHDPTGRNASVNERALQFWDARSALCGTAFLGRGSPSL